MLDGIACIFMRVGSSYGQEQQIIAVNLHIKQYFLHRTLVKTSAPR